MKTIDRDLLATATGGVVLGGNNPLYDAFRSIYHNAVRPAIPPLRSLPELPALPKTPQLPGIA